MWVPVTPEKPESAFESAMYPLESGRTYRGIALIPSTPAGIPEKYLAAAPLAAVAALGSYGVPSGVYWSAPAEWPQESWSVTDDGYRTMWFELMTVRDGVLRDHVSLPIPNAKPMRILELWKSVTGTVPAPPPPAPGPAPAPSPRPQPPAPTAPPPGDQPPPDAQSSSGGGTLQLFATLAAVSGAVVAAAWGYMWWQKQQQSRGRLSPARENPIHGWYVRTERRRGRVIAYGPFESELDAIRANIFARPVSEYDAAAQSRKLRVYLQLDVTRYTDDEIEYLKKYPEEMGYKSYAFHPANCVPMHASWRSIDPDFRDYLFRDASRVLGG